LPVQLSTELIWLIKFLRIHPNRSFGHSEYCKNLTQYYGVLFWILKMFYFDRIYQLSTYISTHPNPK